MVRPVKRNDRQNLSIFRLGRQCLFHHRIDRIIDGSALVTARAAVENMSFDLALNTAVSFVTNTNWQAYAGEEALTNLSQALGLTVQNFLSAAVGLAVLCALIRGLQQNKTYGREFWQDVTRSLLYILLPLSLMLAILLLSQGVVQTFSSGVEVNGFEGESFWMALGPVASQIAIKQLGTNGGGFFGANAAHHLKTQRCSVIFRKLSDLVAASCFDFAFGFWIKEWKQGRTILITATVF